MYQKIKYFLKAAETESFSTAAREMYISSQALTKQIGVLEKELGAPLFERSHQGVRLTEFGITAKEKLQYLVEEMSLTIEDLQGIAKSDRVSLKVGFFFALPQDELTTPVFSVLMTFFKEYQISIEMVDFDEGRRKLNDGALDILLTLVHGQHDLSGNKCLIFKEYETKLAVSLAHPWVMKEKITVADMKSETFLMLDLEMQPEKVRERDSFYLNVPCRTIRHAKNFNTMMMMIRQAEGFSILPGAIAGLGNARVQMFDYPGKCPSFYTVLMYKEDNRNRGLQRVVEELTDEFDLIELEV